MRSWSQYKGLTMQTFSFFIHDQRYAVPTLQFVLVKDEARARELARRELMSSDHHLAVEVRDERGAAFWEERPPEPGCA